jgi:hypothetical protein
MNDDRGGSQGQTRFSSEKDRLRMAGVLLMSLASGLTSLAGCAAEPEDPRSSTTNAVSSSAASGGSGGQAGASSSSSGDGGTPMVCAPGSTEACYGGPPETQDVGLCAGGLMTCDADGMAYGPCVGEIVPAVEDCAAPEDEDCSGVANICPIPGVFAALYGDAGSQYGASIGVDPANNWLVTGAFSGTIDFGGAPLVSAGNNDIFLAKLDGSGSPIWTRRFGDAEPQAPRSIAVDAQGSAILFGTFRGSIDFGGGPIVAATDPALFLAKIDASGNHVFSKSIPYGHATEDGFDRVVAVAPSGEILIACTFVDTVDFGAETLTSAGGEDVFVAKFNAQGGYLWSKRFGDALSQLSDSVTVDSLGDVILTGGFKGTIDFGGGPLAATPGAGNHQIDIYLAKLDTDGNHVWSKRFGLDEAQIGADVAVDGSDNILFTGATGTVIDLGGGDVPPQLETTTCFVAKMTPDGDYLWDRGYACHFEDSGPRVAIGPSDEVVVTGDFTSIGDFGAGPVVANNDSDDAFVLRLDSSGAYVASMTFGTPDYDSANEAAVDSLGNVIVTGSVSGSVDLGSGRLTAGGGSDAFVLKLPP